jgi:NitT/TauT family transport system ATP-binding protein
MDQVKVTDLKVEYQAGGGSMAALAGLSFSAEPGEIVSVIGPSGCGKSTLIYCLAGLLQPTSGTVEINEQTLDHVRPTTAVILQDYGLIPWKTVYANAALGLKLRRSPRPETAAEVERILKQFGLWDVRLHYPNQISGGQRQRVAIARALTLQPSLLLMDEPFSSLDALTREDLQNVFLDVWRRDRLTTFLVTHSIEEAVFLGHKILVLTDRPARLAALIDNPPMTDPDFRTSTAFLRTCSDVRALLREAKTDVA